MVPKLRKFTFYVGVFSGAVATALTCYQVTVLQVLLGHTVALFVVDLLLRVNLISWFMIIYLRWCISHVVNGLISNDYKFRLPCMLSHGQNIRAQMMSMGHYISYRISSIYFFKILESLPSHFISLYSHMIMVIDCSWRLAIVQGTDVILIFYLGLFIQVYYYINMQWPMALAQFYVKLSWHFIKFYLRMNLINVFQFANPPP